MDSCTIAFQDGTVIPFTTKREQREAIPIVAEKFVGPAIKRMIESNTMTDTTQFRPVSVSELLADLYRLRESVETCPKNYPKGKYIADKLSSCISAITEELAGGTDPNQRDLELD